MHLRLSRGGWRRLKTARDESDTAIEALKQTGVDIPDAIRNYPGMAWGKLSESGGVAHTLADTLNVPTMRSVRFRISASKCRQAAAKTLLAASALERLIGKRADIVDCADQGNLCPNQNRTLESGTPLPPNFGTRERGRVKMLEKDDPFNRDDIANYLCVMLIMLPATNRQKGKEFLRMFRDSGRYPSFFPEIDDVLGDCPPVNRLSRFGV